MMTTTTHGGPIASLLLGLALTGCGSDDTTTGPGAGGAASGAGGAGSGGSSDVSGTVTLPSDATGACVMVAVDDNTTGSDRAVAILETEVTGASVAFGFKGVAAGSYFLWAYVDVDGSSSDPAAGCTITGAPASGDFLGYYGTDSLQEPGAPNVNLPQGGSATFDFSIGVFP